MSDINSEVNRQNVEAANHCRCHERKELARAYVPMQGFGEISRPEIGLRNGTIFPDLLSPYVRLTQSGR
ncbi:MAG: spore coat associated protein CotJA [Defluviitaleaceae bacterium]|nr:spore coat associated protein CotJA [Defluviitaleaceae bacterium]